MSPRWRRWPLVLLLVAVTPIGAACAGRDRAGGPPPVTVATTDPVDPDGPASFIAYLDAAQAVDRVAVGQRFGLLVRTEPRRGLRWRITAGPDPAILATLGNELVTDNTQVPEAPDTQVFSFVGRAAGTTQVTLEEVLADGQPAADREPVTFTVIVTPDGQPPATVPPPAEGAEGSGTTTTTRGSGASRDSGND